MFENTERADVSGIEWPYNLLQQIGAVNDDPFEHMATDVELLIAICLRQSITERERKVLMLRYYEQKTQKEVGKIFGITGSRVREIEAKAIRKMRSYESEYILRNGIKAYFDKRVNEKVSVLLKQRMEELEEEYRIKMAGAVIKDDETKRAMVAKLMETTIEEMDLSVRGYNCLHRAGVRTVRDLLRMFPTYERAVKIRNLGRKSLEEIIEKVQGLGFAWPLYENDE